MTDEAAQLEDVAKPSSKMPLVLGLVAALLGGGVGFFLTYSGMLLGPAEEQNQVDSVEKTGPLPDIAFVEVDPIIVSLGTVAEGRHLQFRTQLEVPSQYEDDVRILLPRVVDVLNGYLRALEPRDIESTAALTRLRSQMLRRVKIVAGEERVRDLLIMEFVIN